MTKETYASILGDEPIMTNDDWSRVSVYRNIRTEAQGIALAHQEGYKEEIIEANVGVWQDHYRRHAKTFLSASRQLRDKIRREGIPLYVRREKVGNHA